MKVIINKEEYDDLVNENKNLHLMLKAIEKKGVRYRIDGSGYTFLTGKKLKVWMNNEVLNLKKSISELQHALDREKSLKEQTQNYLRLLQRSLVLHPKDWISILRNRSLSKRTAGIEKACTELGIK